MLWTAFIVMAVIAVVFTVWPLVRDTRRRAGLTVAAVVVVAGLSAAMYAYNGRPDVPSGRSAGQPQDLETMIASLAARLEDQPDDLAGWKMLGRSQMSIGRFNDAANAFERALEIESPQSPQTLVEYGLALSQADGQTMPPRAISAFENALALDPNNPEALFYGGIAAANRGDTSLAADRWEALLLQDTPDEIRDIVSQRVAEWRGEPVQRPVPAALPEPPSAVVSASIAVSEEADAALPDDATVFVIARDPAQPSPPIAVVRRSLAELPAVVSLDDADSMIPGRNLSAFEEFELVARVSLSGSPVAQPGDWFGTVLVRPAELTEIDLPISERVE